MNTRTVKRFPSTFKSGQTSVGDNVYGSNLHTPAPQVLGNETWGIIERYLDAKHGVKQGSLSLRIRYQEP